MCLSPSFCCLPDNRGTGTGHRDCLCIDEWHWVLLELMWKAQPAVAPHAVSPEKRVTADVTRGEEACWSGVDPAAAWCPSQRGTSPSDLLTGTPSTYGGRGGAGAAGSPGEPQHCPQGGGTTLPRRKQPAGLQSRLTVNFHGPCPSARGPLLWQLECLCLCWAPTWLQ